MLIVACTTTNDLNIEAEAEIRPRAFLDGIWIGEFDIRGRGPYDFTAVHLNDKAFAYSLKAKTMCVGTLAFDGKHIINKYVLFALDGGPFDWATLTGTLNDDGIQPKNISTYFKTLNGGDTGVLSVTYSNIYDQPSSLEALQGVWSFTDRDDLTTSITINEEGALSGKDSDGCEYIGNIDIIDPEYNAYHAKLEISACSSVSDEYEGVIFINENILTMQIANKNYALFFAFEKK
jgi:hypothetical protein